MAGVGDRTEPAVEDVVALVGHEAGARHGRAAERGQRARADGLAERDHLDRHRRLLAEVRDALRRVADDHEPVGRRGHDLLAQQRPAEPLDESELGAISSAPSMQTASCGCSASVASGTPCSRASAAVASDVGTATMPVSSPAREQPADRDRDVGWPSNPVPSPSAMPLPHLGRDGGLRGCALGVAPVMAGTAPRSGGRCAATGRRRCGSSAAPRLGSLGHAAEPRPDQTQRDLEVPVPRRAGRTAPAARTGWRAPSSRRGPRTRRSRRRARSASCASC